MEMTVQIRPPDLLMMVSTLLLYLYPELTQLQGFVHTHVNLHLHSGIRQNLPTLASTAWIRIYCSIFYQEYLDLRRRFCATCGLAGPSRMLTHFGSEWPTALHAITVAVRKRSPTFPVSVLASVRPGKNFQERWTWQTPFVRGKDPETLAETVLSTEGFESVVALLAENWS